jgi:hypothetical protein
MSRVIDVVELEHVHPEEGRLRVEPLLKLKQRTEQLAKQVILSVRIEESLLQDHLPLEKKL